MLPYGEIGQRIPDVVEGSAVSVVENGRQLRATCEIDATVAGEDGREETKVTRHAFGQKSIRSRGQNDVAPFSTLADQKGDHRLVIRQERRIQGDPRYELALEECFAFYQPERQSEQKRRPGLNK